MLGLALVGFGLGPGSQSWGGELLRVDPGGYDRLGHLAPLSQPGGDVAAREPWRMGAAALHALGRGDEIATRFADRRGAPVIAQMLARGLNAPPTSSAGRLFDAACGLLGVKPVASFEGEAPMALEAMVDRPAVDPEGWALADGVLDMRPLLDRLLGMEPEAGADLFHGTLAAALAAWVGWGPEGLSTRRRPSPRHQRAPVGQGTRQSTTTSMPSSTDERRRHSIQTSGATGATTIRSSSTLARTAPTGVTVRLGTPALAETPALCGPPEPSA